MASPTNTLSVISKPPSRKTKNFSLAGWHGYMPTVITPFNQNFSIDFLAFAEILQWLMQEEMHGFVIAGTTSEWTALTKIERLNLFEKSRAIIPKNKPLIAGCSALRVEESIDYIKHAETIGMDGILLTIPPYVCPTDTEIIHFFQTVTKKSTLPFIIYNWPQGTGVDLSMPVIDELTQIENIVALKNSTPNFEHFIAILEAFHQAILIFGIMPGKSGLELLRQHGGAGCIGAAGVLGRKQPGFFNAVWAGNWDLAEILGDYDDNLMKSCFHNFQGKFGHAVSTFKFLLHLRGLPAGTVRPPLLPLSAKAEKDIKEIVTHMELFKDV